AIVTQQALAARGLASMAGRTSCVPAWFDQRPNLNGAAHLNGGQRGGKVENGVGGLALHKIEGAQGFVRLPGCTLCSHELAVRAADACGRSCWSKPVVGDHVDGGTGRRLKVIVQRPMRTVKGSLALRVETF